MTVLQQFHRDESAQISFLAVAGAVCFIALLSMIINTDDVIAERVHMQDVADATVLSAAAWTARGLNTIAFINVLNTKLISTAVLINALADTIPVTIAVGEVQRAIFQGCTGVPFVGAFCAAMAVVVNVQLRALNVMKRAVDRMARTLSRCDKGSAALWKLMKALEELGNGVRVSFGVIGIAESISIARANGADFGIVLNGMLTKEEKQLALPVRKGKFRDHCPHLKNGGPGFELQNYSCNKGPLETGRERINKTLLVPFVNLAAHPIFAGMVTRHMRQIGCPPAPGEEETGIPVTLRDLDQCSKYDTDARWAHTWAKTVELSAADADQYSLEDFIPWRPRNEPDPSASEEEAPDLDTVTGQLEDLGLPSAGAPGGASDAEITVGKGVELIPGNEERSPPIYYGDQIACRTPRYPLYTPPSPVPDYNWDAELPGRVYTARSVCSFLCRPLPEWDEFTWVSGSGHVVGGPETVGGYFIRVDKRQIEPEEEGAEPTYRFIVETVALVDAGQTEMDEEEFKKHLEEQGGKKVNTEGTKSSKGCSKPEPFVLEKKGKDFDDKLRFIGVVWKDTGDSPPFWSTFFEDPPPTMIAYAQGQVYNYLSEDTFTQDWRVRLEHATLLESLVATGKAGALNNKGLAADLISKVNNH